MKPNAMYLRKSRSDPEDETTEETLDKHKRTLTEFTQKAGLEISEIYKEVVSGDGLFLRPQMVRLMQNINAGKYGGIVCMDIDRLGRVDTKDRGIILDCFKSAGTLIITPQKTYDLSDEIDEFSTEMQMLFARQELKKITKRLHAGLIRAASDGCHVGEPPLGYKRAYEGKKPTLEIEESEAGIVRLIFDMYVNDKIGATRIADKLNAMGLKTRNGGNFTRSSVGFILSNEVYIGKIIYNKRRKIKKKMPEDKQKCLVNPKDRWIVAEGLHCPIIDKDLFYRAQKIRLARSNPPSNNGIVANPLAGLIKCSNCGGAMVRRSSKKEPPRLLCTKPGCNPSVHLDLVEKRLFDILKDVFENEKLLCSPKSAEPSETLKTGERLKKQLSVLNRQNDNIHDLLEQGVYDAATFQKRQSEISEKLNAVQQAIRQNASAVKAAKNIVKPPDTDVMQYFSDICAKMTPLEINTVYKMIFKSIYYKHSGDSFDLTVNFNDWV